LTKFGKTKADFIQFLVVRKWLTGQKEGEVVPKVVNREPIFGVLFSPPSPRFLAVAVWHSFKVNG